MALEIIASAGRDSRRRALVLVRCTCGNEKVLRADNVKKQRHCDLCALNRCRKSKRGPAAPTASQQAPLQPVHGTPAWYKAAITSLTQAAERLETQARDFEAGITAGGIEAMGEESRDRLWHRALSAAAKMRTEIARLDKEMREREVGTPVVKRLTTTAERIAALKVEK